MPLRQSQVSIPLRYADNIQGKYGQDKGFMVSIPLRYADNRERVAGIVLTVMFQFLLGTLITCT